MRYFLEADRARSGRASRSARCKAGTAVLRSRRSRGCAPARPRSLLLSGDRDRAYYRLNSNATSITPLNGSPEEMPFLTQHPYMLVGSLRMQMVYPHRDRAVSDEELMWLLEMVNMLDEATSALDVKNEERLYLRLQETATTLVSVTIGPRFSNTTIKY